MSSAPATVTIERLLAHREWVRRLARPLVQDEATLDDLEQRTWLRVLHASPRSVTAVRAWLRRVVRNEAANLHRGRARRANHEGRAPIATAAPSTVDVVARAELVNRLADAVMELDEPFRTTLLLRYFEDLPPRVVAVRMSVPVETVRSRQKRAIARLRVRLDEDGGRAAWMSALTPLAVAPRSTATVGTGGAVASTGGALMSAKTIVAASVLTFLAGLAGAGLVGWGAPETEPDPRVAALEARLETLESSRRQEASRGDRRASGAGGSARSPSAHSRATEELDALAAELDALDARLGTPVTSEAPSPAPEAAESENDLSTDELLVEIDRRTKIARDSKATADAEAVFVACDDLLARELTPEQRAAGFVYRNRAHQVLGELDAAEADLRRALAAAGETTPKGHEVAHDLGMLARLRGDSAAAARWFLSIAEQDTASDASRAFYRYAGASDLLAAGEFDRARAEFESVVTQFGESEVQSIRRWVKLAEKGITLVERERRAE